MLKFKHFYFFSFFAIFIFLFMTSQSSAYENLNIQFWKTNKANVPVYFISSRNLPMLDISVNFNGGKLVETADKAGIAGFTNSMLDKGTNLYDENSLDEALADLGAEMHFPTDSETNSVRLRSLTNNAQNLQKSVDILINVLTKPKFDAKILHREIANTVAELKDALTRPNVQARKNFAKNVYPHHPYGAVLTEQSLQNIKIADIKAFHTKYYVAENAKIVMVGDLSKSQAEQIAEQIATNLPQGEIAKFPEFPEKTKQAKKIVIPHPATQSHILVGQVGIARSNEDYFAMLVGNYTLGGGGFQSRLLDEIREKRGLAYSVSSYFRANKHPGSFGISMQTKKQSTNEALNLIQQIVSDFVKNGPTDEELAIAKNYLIGSFPLNVDSNGKMLEQVSRIANLDLPLNTLQVWQENIRKISKDDVIKAFQRNIHPENFVTIVVGGEQ